MRSLTLLAAASLLMVPFAASVPAGLEPSDAWRAKADAHLQEAMARGEGPWTFVVQGPALPAPSQEPQDRAAWRAHWAAASEPFLAQLRAEVARLGGEVLGETPAANAAHVRLASARIPDLLEHPEVRLAGLDWEGATRILQGGPGTTATLNQTLAKLQVPDLWALGYRGEGVKLAVIDTGIRGTHETMKRADNTTRVAAWFDATSGNCASPCDTNGHGTHVASTAAGSNLFNPSAPEGAAPRATIYGVRIFIGASGTWQDAQEGLQAAFDMGAEVTTNSWGGTCGGDATVTAELAETLAGAGMLSVFAAGNSGPDNVGCPGAVDKLVTVGGIDVNDNVYSSGSRGPCSWEGATRACPDVVAVAVNVVAATSSCDTCYASLTGTSMATPQVAGVVVLLQQAKLALHGQGLDAARAEPDALLKLTARDLGPAGVDDDFGWGTAQAKDAYLAMASGAGPDVRAGIGTGQATVRSYNDAVVSFGVANVGGAAVQGRLVHTIQQVDTGLCPPQCEAITVTDEDVSLARGDHRVSSYHFRGSEHRAGTFLVTGTFTYTYTDPADGLTKAGSVSRAQSFLVKKVAWVKERAVPADMATGTLVGGLQLRNVGNEAAGNVRVTDSYDIKGFAAVPRAPPGQPLPGGLFADPPPSVSASLAQQRVTFTWAIGTVAPGTGWSATYTLAATVPGTYNFLGDLQFVDETGRALSERLDQAAVVHLP